MNRRQWTERTRLRYEGLLRLHIRPAIGTLGLTELRVHHVEALLLTLTDRPATARYCKAVTRTMLADALRHDLVDTNVAALARLPRSVGASTLRPVRDIPSIESAERVAAAGGGSMVLAAAYSGLRWGELSRLHSDDLDLANRVIRVRQSKTEAGVRSVIFARELTPHLRGASGILWPSSTGQALNYSNWRRDTCEIETTVRRFAGEGTGLKVNTRTELPAADADALRVRQILRNLISNAVRYGGPSIRISTRVVGGRIEVVVADDGDGVPPEDAKTIFLAYRRSTISDHAASVGLGLWVSQHLAEAMGGTLGYRRVDGWTEFVLGLDVCSSEDADVSLPQPSAA